jgi:hypothetical protein
MAIDDPAAATLEELVDISRLYLRRQCGLTTLRVTWDRAATRLRLLSPDDAEVLRSFVDLLDVIERTAPPPRQHMQVASLVDRLRDYVRSRRLPVPPPAGLPA